MKVWTLVILLAGLLTSCNYLYRDPAPQLIESEMDRLEGCRRLGVINGNADPGNLSEYDAAYRMMADIKTRAVRMGATHIVWLYKGPLSATAVVFQCDPE